MLEKATELGVRRNPARCSRAAAWPSKLNLERARAIVWSKRAEQCARTRCWLDGPKSSSPRCLREWPSERTLFFADELGGTPAAAAFAAQPGPAAILIGPEGGFDDAEREAIRAHPQARCQSRFGPRILRGETAALAAAVALWMGACWGLVVFRAIWHWRDRDPLNGAAMSTRQASKWKPPIERRDSARSPRWRPARSRPSAGASAPSTRSWSSRSPTTARPPYEEPGGIHALLIGAHRSSAGSRSTKARNVIALEGPDGNVSLEPAGQLELSGAPLENLHQTCAETGRHLEQVKAVGEALASAFSASACGPTRRRDERPIMPKGRYGIMLQPHAARRHARVST